MQPDPARSLDVRARRRRRESHPRAVGGGRRAHATLLVDELPGPAGFWVTSRRCQLDAAELRSHVVAVAAHRGQPVIPMAEALAHMPVRQGPCAAMVDRMSYLSPPPQRWSDLIDGVVEFVDPLLADTSGRLSHWDHEQLAWS